MLSLAATPLRHEKMPQFRAIDTTLLMLMPFRHRR